MTHHIGLINDGLQSLILFSTSQAHMPIAQDLCIGVDGKGWETHNSHTSYKILLLSQRIHRFSLP